MGYQRSTWLELIQGFGFPDMEILFRYSMYGGNRPPVVHDQKRYTVLNPLKLCAEVGFQI